METTKKLKENVFSAKLTTYEFNQLLVTGGKIKLILTDGDRAIQREIPITVDEKEDLSVVTEEEASKIIGTLMYGGSIWEAARETNRSTDVVDKVFKEFHKQFK
jgi:hypothetical protein